MYSHDVLWVILALLLVIAGLCGALLGKKWDRELYPPAPRRRRRVRASCFKDHCYGTYCLRRLPVEGREHGAEEDGPRVLH